MVEDDITAMKKAVGVPSDTQLAHRLGYTQAAVSQWRKRGNVPEKARRRAEKYLEGGSNTVSRKPLEIPQPVMSSAPFDGPLHPEEIKARIRVRYGTVQRFEQEKRLSSGAVSQVINTGLAWEAAAQAIADELCIPLHRVSARYYNKMVLSSVSGKRRTAHRQNAGAL